MYFVDKVIYGKGNETLANIILVYTIIIMICIVVNAVFYIECDSNLSDVISLLQVKKKV